MGIFQSDLTIKTAIELGIDDLRKNPWLVDDILSDAVTNVYLKDKYGQKQVDSAKEWFKNNQIDIYMRQREDKDRLPCVTISLGSSQEKEQMKTMGDSSTETIILLPNVIGKPIPYIVKPFVPDSYDPSTGEVGVNEKIPNIDQVSIGMILVNPANGQGFIIQDIIQGALVIEAGIDIEMTTQFAVVPKFQYYEARVEHTFFQETYNIGCHAHGDPQALLWLHSVVLYSILRYRESLFEANGFAECVVSSSDMVEDPNYTGPGGEKAFSRYITLTGQVENSWIKSPRRFIETVALKEKVGKGFLGGIKILSNSDTPPFVDKTQETWYTDAENETDPNDPEDQDE
jgi:hypothetical protein